MKLIQLAFILIALSLLGCQDRKPSGSLDLENLNTQEEVNAAGVLQSDNMDEIIQSIPSPLELAAVIRNSGAEFKNGLTNPESNEPRYVSSYDKAFNLGVYGSDLGYINMYEKSYHALNYLRVIKDLADDLNVGHFFDFATIKRYASNSDKVDSLLYISTVSLNRMDNYLREQDRSHLSALILAGTWLEGLYIASEIASISATEELLERIGEQKVVLHQVLRILDSYKDDPYFAELIAQYGRIREIFDGVEIEYFEGTPETREVNGRLVIINNSFTEVNISSEQVQSIRETAAEIRTKMINA